MKNKSDILCNICHDAIHTQAIFFDNNQVYLKKFTGGGSKGAIESAQWFPINFQWIPILHHNKELNHQLNTSSK